MTKFALTLTLVFASSAANANMHGCIAATRNLSSIIGTYTSLMKSCQESQGSQFYSQYQVLARDTETLYRRAQQDCSNQCSFEAFSQKLCWNISDLHGACP